MRFEDTPIEDASGYTGRAEAVHAPASEDELCSVLARASADRIPVEELQPKALEVTEHLHPEVEDRALTDPLGEVGVGVLDRPAYHEEREERARRPEEPFPPRGPLPSTRWAAEGPPDP